MDLKKFTLTNAPLQSLLDRMIKEENGLKKRLVGLRVLKYVLPYGTRKTLTTGIFNSVFLLLLVPGSVGSFSMVHQ